MELLVIFEFECMHAGFHFVFSGSLSQRFAGSASTFLCIFDICKGPGNCSALAKADPGFVQQSR
jgi:hypothetical protein